jgi:hypothetical protein
MTVRKPARSSELQLGNLRAPQNDIQNTCGYTEWQSRVLASGGQVSINQHLKEYACRSDAAGILRNQLV